MATRFSCSVLFRPSILVCITSKSLVQIFIKMPMARIISGMTTSSTTASRGLMEMLIPRAAMSITGARTSIRRPIFNIMVMALTSLVMRVMRVLVPMVSISVKPSLWMCSNRAWRREVE